MAHRTAAHRILDTAKHEALLAVDLYNRPRGYRYLEAHVVHMHLAWLYLTHAVLRRNAVDYRYRDGHARLVRTADGEIKLWELSESIRHLYPNVDDPVRRNVEFFIALRNKIEHRHARVIDPVVAGRVQSNVLNFESKLVAEFGQAEGLGEDLRLPIFISTLTGDAAQAVKRAYELLPVKIRRFIAGYDDALPAEVRDHPSYDLRIYLIPKTAPKAIADAALEFVRLDQMGPDEQAATHKWQVIVRDRQVGVASKGMMKPTEVARKVQQEIKWRFSASNHHASAWKHFGVRPQSDASNPYATEQRYCIYDEPHKDYLYTDAWVRKLIKELKTASGFRAVTRVEPVTKSVS